MIADFFTNRITLCVLTAFFAAETIKFVVAAFLTRDWSLRNFISSGGMPSSHTASVVSLAAAIGLTEGFDSPLFTACGVFAFVVMTDAAGVRRETGRQGSVINRIQELIFGSDDDDDSVDMKERVGHSPLEVVIGAILGILIALAFFAI